MIGALLGLLGAVAGIGAAVWGLGYFEYLGGKKKSPISPKSKEELKQKLLALNSPELPYEIKPAKETDLIVEWKIADARCYALFTKERLSKIYRAFLMLDESRKAARYCEEMGEVRWSVGSEGIALPKARFRSEIFRGRILFQKSWGVQYAIREDLTVGKVYEYKFDVGYVRDPIVKAVTGSGWEFVPVVRKEHATYKSLKAQIAQ